MLTDVFSVFQKGGYVMYPLLLCSVFGVAVTLERLFYYQQCRSEPQFLKKLKLLLEAKNYTEAAALAENESGHCAQLTSRYLNYRSHGLSIVESLANEMLESYEENLVYLKMIVTAAPLLGLLGTILGMIHSFNVFDLRAGQPFAITSGIGEALIATAFGLIVAILTLFLYGLLMHKISILRKQLMHCCQSIELSESDGDVPCV